jgi:acetamidase/formamidase
VDRLRRLAFLTPSCGGPSADREEKPVTRGSDMIRTRTNQEQLDFSDPNQRRLLGVHICTGPVYVRNAEPGDILEVRIMDVKPRPSANPAYAGKAFGSNAAAWWGFHYKELITEPKPREVITIFEIDATGHGFSFANYLQELGPTAQQTIYEKSSVDLALKDAFRKMRAFLMTTKGLTEDEAIALISIAVDFEVTQVVDGNWGVHAIIKKSLFAGGEA